MRAVVLVVSNKAISQLVETSIVRVVAIKYIRGNSRQVTTFSVKGTA